MSDGNRQRGSGKATKRNPSPKTIGDSLLLASDAIGGSRREIKRAKRLREASKALPDAEAEVASSRDSARP